MYFETQSYVWAWNTAKHFISYINGALGIKYYLFNHSWDFTNIATTIRGRDINMVQQRPRRVMNQKRWRGFNRNFFVVSTSAIGGASINSNEARFCNRLWVVVDMCLLQICVRN